LETADVSSGSRFLSQPGWQRAAEGPTGRDAKEETNSQNHQETVFKELSADGDVTCPAPAIEANGAESKPGGFLDVKGAVPDHGSKGDQQQQGDQRGALDAHPEDQQQSAKDLEPRQSRGHHVHE
jgi:hypothetical protein